MHVVRAARREREREREDGRSIRFIAGFLQPLVFLLEGLDPLAKLVKRSRDVAILRVPRQVQRLGPLLLEKRQLDVVGQEQEGVGVRHGVGCACAMAPRDRATATVLERRSEGMGIRRVGQHQAHWQLLRGGGRGGVGTGQFKGEARHRKQASFVFRLADGSLAMLFVGVCRIT